MENLENIEEKKKKQIKLNLKELVIIVMAFICVVLGVYAFLGELPYLLH